MDLCFISVIVFWLTQSWLRCSCFNTIATRIQYHRYSLLSIPGQLSGLLHSLRCKHNLVGREPARSLLLALCFWKMHASEKLSVQHKQPLQLPCIPQGPALFTWLPGYMKNVMWVSAAPTDETGTKTTHSYVHFDEIIVFITFKDTNICSRNPNISVWMWN